tara:strand:- start:21398 stop:23440 length:2043 start_codon:yes stop_codon:yes gene_type:complete
VAAKSSPISESKNTVSLGAKIKIYYDRPLPEYDHGPLKAYEAVSYLNDVTKCYALICERAYMPRLTLVENYVRVNNPGLVNLVGNGVVFWTPAKEERYVFVYQTRASAQKISDDKPEIALGLSPSMVLKNIIPPFVSILTDLEHKRINHGSLCLSNVFAQYQDNNIVDVFIGDMLSLPYGMAQPSIYKTVPTALAEQGGIGTGYIANDIYAFGVCVALMLRTKDPMEGKSDDFIIEAKLQKGSYATLLDKQRFSGPFLELLKGVLQDDPLKRWSVEEISLWYDGRQLSPKQNPPPKIAPRPLEFENKKYNQIATLAKELSKAPASAAHLVESGQLSHWLERALSDKKAVARYERAMGFVRENLKTHEKNIMIASNLAIGMNTANPIFYKGRALYPEAFGDKLIEATEKGEDPNPIVEILKQGLFNSWFIFKLEAGGSDYLGMSEHFEAARNALRGKKTGYGVERCIYMLSKRVHCMSPLLKNVIAYDAAEIALKLDRLLEQNPKAVSQLMDRHIAAFLIEREPQVIERRLFDLDSPHQSEVMHAILSCYAAIQKRHKIDSLPHLAKALLKKIKPCYRVFYDLTLRKTIEDKVSKAAEKGDLPGMLSMIEDPVTRSRDRKAYNSAVEEYYKLEIESQELQMNLIDRSSFNKSFGREISAMIASGLSIIVIVFIAISFYTGG